MSFRQYGGINYAAKNNIVKNNYNNANNLSVMTKVGQPNSIINFESDISGNTLYGTYDFIGNVTVSGNLDVSGSIISSSDCSFNSVTVGKGGKQNGYGNTAVGGRALAANKNGDGNTAIGRDALLLAVDGSFNTVLGYGAMDGYDPSGNSTNAGKYNVAIGNFTLRSNKGGTINDPSGNYNTAVGYQALAQNRSGYNNTAIGMNAAFSNTTGSDNTANGYQALFSNTTGLNNTANGFAALCSNTTGDYNTANGFAALFCNETGIYNTAVGLNSLYNNTIGNYNTAIGYNAGPTSETLSNTTALGHNAIPTQDNQIVLGSGSITSLKCNVALTVTSDARDKTNFESLDAGMNFINQMKPLRFDWNQREGGLEGRKDVGFTAQDLLEAQEITGIKIPNLVDTHNPDKYTVMYTQVIPILVKAVQELSSTVTRLEGEIEELKRVKN